MTSVQENSSNNGWATLGGTLAGGVGGAGIAYLQTTMNKPSQRFREDVMEAVCKEHSEFKPIHEKYNNLLEKLNKIDNNTEVDKFISSNKIKIPEEVTEKLKTANLEEKKVIAESCLETDKFYEVKNKMEKMHDWEVLHDNFIQKSENLTEETKKIIEKTKTSFLKKTALIYAGLGAIVLGLGTYFLTKNKD